MFTEVSLRDLVRATLRGELALRVKWVSSVLRQHEHQAKHSYPDLSWLFRRW
jgi:hypothetical protein